VLIASASMSALTVSERFAPKAAPPSSFITRLVACSAMNAPGSRTVILTLGFSEKLVPILSGLASLR
jgi:hypothetical protein